MSIFDKTIAALQIWAAQAVLKRNPITRLAAQTDYKGSAQPHTQDFDSTSKAFAANPWVYVAANTIGKNLSAAPMVVEELKTVEGEQQWTVTDTGELAEIIKRPNKDEPFDFLTWRTVLSLLTAGNGYWASPADEHPRELHWLPPAWTKVIVDETEGPVGYTVTNRGKKVAFDYDEVIHFKLPNPLHEFYGYAPIDVVNQQILLDYYGSRNLKDYFKNSAIPVGALTTEQAITSAEVKEKTRHEWEKLHRGVGSGSRTAILDQGLKYQTITPPLKDMVVNDLFKLTREQLLALFGLPPVLAGIFEFANYANSSQQITIFWKNTILPLMRIMSGIINVQYAPQFGENIRVRFDLSQIEALQDDETEKATRVVTLHRGGIITRNEAREIIGREAVEGGDEFAAAQSGFGIGSAIDDGSGKGLLDSPSGGPVLSKGGDTPSSLLWKAHDARLKRHEKKMQTAMAGFFDEQLDRLLRAIKKETSNGRALSRIGVLLSKDGDDLVDPSDANDLFNIEVENAELVEAVGPVIRRSVHQAGQDAIEQVTLGVSFDVDNPMVHNVIERFQNRITTVNNASYKKIKRILKDSYDAGEGIPKIERKLRDTFSEFTKTRSRAIARTEMNGIVNSAALEGHKQVGVTHKVWIATRDGATRDAHIHADGEKAIIGQPFIMTGEPMMTPGDPNGSGGNTINCRCTYAPVVE